MSYTDSQKLKILESFTKLSNELQAACNGAYSAVENIVATSHALVAQPPMPDYGKWPPVDFELAFNEAVKRETALEIKIQGLREELNKTQILLAGADMDRASQEAHNHTLNKALVAEVLENKELRKRIEKLEIEYTNRPI